MGGISTFRNVGKEVGADALGQRARQTPHNDEEEGTMRTALRLTVAIVVLALVGTLAGPGTAQGKHKVAFIYVGPVGDAGWTYQHDQARQYLEQTLGVETKFVESVPETAEVARVEEQFIRQGFTVIFATAFGYQNFNVQVRSEEHTSE